MYTSANLNFLFKEAGSLLKRYEAAAVAGFRRVECDFPGKDLEPSQLAEAVEKHRLRQELMNCFHGDAGEFGFGATPGAEQSFRDSLQTTLEYARATKCKKLHLLSGYCLGPEKEQDQLRTLESNLRWASEVLSKEGADVIGVIEPINRYAKPNYFMNSFERAVSILEKLNLPNIRLQLDLFHLQLICGDVTNSIKRLIPLTGHVQVAQTPHRHEPSFPGELNMKYVFDELRKAGYEGSVGCEYIPSTANTADSLAWILDYGLKY